MNPLRSPEVLDASVNAPAAWETACAPLLALKSSAPQAWWHEFRKEDRVVIAKAHLMFCDVNYRHYVVPTAMRLIRTSCVGGKLLKWSTYRTAMAPWIRNNDHSFLLSLSLWWQHRVERPVLHVERELARRSRWLIAQPSSPVKKGQGVEGSSILIAQPDVAATRLGRTLTPSGKQPGLPPRRFRTAYIRAGTAG